MENNENSSSCSYTEEDELFNYIASQDEKKVNDFLKRKKLRVYEFRNKDGKNSSLLHTSVYKKNYNIVKSLIDYCKLNFPDHLVKFVNGENSKGICPIHYASFGGNLDIIKLSAKSWLKLILYFPERYSSSNKNELLNEKYPVSLFS